MMIHEITEKVGRYKTRKRVGRGRGSGHGKTSGRGHKGAGSRAGWSHRAYFEGGQMPFTRRIPKRGFTNARFRRLYSIVNVKAIEEAFENGAEINAESLAGIGIVRDASLPLKVLGEGTLSKTFNVTAEKFSVSAKTKIEAAGGSVTLVLRPKWTRAAAAAAAAAKTGREPRKGRRAGKIRKDPGAS